MPKRPSNHPKTDPSTGLDWWTSHLQHESRVDDWWDYYEAYDDPQPHPQPERTLTVNARPVRKLAEREIPGTDAWIEAQAERRKKVVGGKARNEKPNAARRPHVPTIHRLAKDPDEVEVTVGQELGSQGGRSDTPTTSQPSSSHLHVYEDDHHEPTKRVVEGTSDRRWTVVFYLTEKIVALTPPTNSTIEDWRQVMAWEPEGTVLYDALYTRELWIRSLLWLPKAARAETQRELSSSLVVRLPEAEFEHLRTAVKNKEADI